MVVLGVSCFFHDSGTALINGGRIIAAAQEERFSRTKGDPTFPHNAVWECLQTAGISIADVDVVAVQDNPSRKLARILEDVRGRPREDRRRILSAWAAQKLHLPRTIREELGFKGKIYFAGHHISHAASAFYPSPFETAAILTIDGVGERSTCTVGIGEGSRIELLNEIHFPHSLGLLYSAITYFLGFRVNFGEYKVMGLAPYGTPRFRDHLREMIHIHEDASFSLDMTYFDFYSDEPITREFCELLGEDPRPRESEILQQHMDLAASVQEVTEEVVMGLARRAKEMTGAAHLAMAGGVALNCVANGKLAREGLFENIWIQPAAGDAGGSLGAAFHYYHRVLNAPRKVGNGDAMEGAFLGPSYSSSYISSVLDSKRAVYTRLDTREQTWERIAAEISKGNVVGVFQGRMEFGPRALGGRSILGDPRDPEMQRKMNVKIKFRESFRPFAPAVKLDAVDEWFEEGLVSPYMLLIDWIHPDKRVPMDEGRLEGFARLKALRSEVPAITHVDLTARLQTVDGNNPYFYGILDAFERLTGCPILINTSFNVRGEPIVASPEDAFNCFMRTDIDVLVLEDTILMKEDQPDREEWSRDVWRSHIPLD